MESETRNTNALYYLTVKSSSSKIPLPLAWRCYVIYAVLVTANVIFLTTERHSLRILNSTNSNQNNDELDANSQNSSGSAKQGFRSNREAQPRNSAQTTTVTTPLIPLTITTTTNTETTDSWPPLEDLVDLQDDSISGIKANVSFLLDIAILGHAKCATTFLVEWLQQHNETALFDREVCDLNDRKPAKLVRRIYQELPHTDQPPATTTTTPLRRGFKCPGHFSSNSLRHLVALFPDTKIMIGLRHPVRYFESYYNFRARHPQRSRNKNSNNNVTVELLPLPPPETLVGQCTSTSQGVCTDGAKFHVNLAKLGKTSRRDPAEQKLLHLTHTQQNLVVPNPLFLYHVEQLYDTNATRREQFRRDVQHFLGLSTPLPPLVPPVPSTRGPKPKALDVCQPQYKQTLRVPLLETGHRASHWILDYLLSDDHGASKNVTVSSPAYFKTILETWTKDPCDERQT